jgi:hypothetical protein
LKLRIAVSAALVAALAGCGGSNKPAAVGRGQSLQPLPIYEELSPSAPARQSRTVEVPGRTPSLPSTRIKIALRPAARLHVTAAEVVDATALGYRLWVYAPEAGKLFPGGVAYHLYVVLYDDVAYRAIPISADPNGLNLSIVLGSVSKGFAASLAGALTSDVRILEARSG